MKKLRFWNGRGHGKYDRRFTIYVAAYSVSEACRLLSRVCFPNSNNTDMIRSIEINKYYSECWGRSMINIKPDKPCVYVVEGYGNSTPLLVYPT